MAHHHYRATLAAGGVKGSRLPPPLKIPRPDPWVSPEFSTETPKRPQTGTGRRHASTVSEVVSVLAHGIRR